MWSHFPGLAAPIFTGATGNLNSGVPADQDGAGEFVVLPILVPTPMQGKIDAIEKIVSKAASVHRRPDRDFAVL
jgi:hypothetical protein